MSCTRGKLITEDSDPIIFVCTSTDYYNVHVTLEGDRDIGR